jgi:hypothetical protein
MKLSSSSNFSFEYFPIMNKILGLVIQLILEKNKKFPNYLLQHFA